MAFGDSSAHVIFFVAAVILASSISAMLVTTVEKVSIGLKVQGENLETKIGTDFKIVNDPVNIPVNNSVSPPEYTFYIKNIGTKSILMTESTLTVLIDGAFISEANLRLNPDGELKPGYLGQIFVRTNLSSGDHKITVILENGHSDSLKFTI
ncbi:MAG: flagellar protein G [Archaeoglobus sp.]|nr:flagellar protein G [Archaeoglobus sp.]